ncbi:hypothetical protein Glove_198g32 [Diversispora epigaea]|uniref:Protein kinase domain-containing protein n=1 Tax=Diversispora epigaea TaxID=1348612 RepID=A0A397IKE3_9GLOM|nr:hypothetical protein Glove_198g32 [Diversispora epigaea]
MDLQYLELFSTIGKNKNSDIFGLGIILWEISNGNSLFEMESSSNVDLLNNITKGKREMAIPRTPYKYKKIYTDCWKHNGNSRPNISQVVKNLSEIIISDASVEPYNVIDSKLENLNVSPFFDVTTDVDVFIKDLFELLIDLFIRQHPEIRPITIKNYIREHKKNSVKILYEMIRNPLYFLFTSLIGFFYQHGIGTDADNQIAFKFFNLAANDISSSDSSSFRELYNINKEISTISLANMYFDGLGVEKDTKYAFRIYCKLADKGSFIALNSVAHCYSKGLGVKKNEEKAFELYLKSAEKGFLLVKFNVGSCYQCGTGITKDEFKGFQWFMKSALAGNIYAMFYVGCSYDFGIGMCKNEKEALKWYLRAAKKENNAAQNNLGFCYRNAFEWFKRAAGNNYSDSQYMLEKLFYGGHGTKRDIINAIYWLNKAKVNGDTDANELLEEIISNSLKNSTFYLRSLFNLLF